jgi:formate/nitrite transporter
LIMVVVGGAELFTGNTLIVMAWAGRKVPTSALLRNWGVVYLGNLTGAAATALLVFLAGQHLMNGGAVGAFAVNLAESKCSAGFLELLIRGVLGNAMVCIAVWLSFSARSTTDRVLVVIPPIAMFVAAGFEHCVANMYFLPAGLLIDQSTGLGSAGALTLAGTAKNLAAVTLGNIIGGGVLVGAMYWFIYLRAPAASSR